MSEGQPILDTIGWLTKGEPWVSYRTHLDIMMMEEDDPMVLQDYEALIRNPRIRAIVDELQSWPGKPIKRHNDADLLLHKMSFLADIGFTIQFDPIREIVTKVTRNASHEGPFNVIVNIPAHIGGSGEDKRSWILCDAPGILYSLVRFGMEKDPQVQKALSHLVLKVHKNGWRCSASQHLGEKIHGYGKEDDPCPYATLLMLKVLGQTETWKFSPACHAGTGVLLDLWENSRTKHPHAFNMGNDFRKLKAPLIWYDLLHVTDVLSQFEWVRNDHRFLDMINLLTSKADLNMRFTAESVWSAWEDWDFGQKKHPSRWLTMLVLRILKRVEVGSDQYVYP